MWGNDVPVRVMGIEVKKELETKLSVALFLIKLSSLSSVEVIIGF